MSDTLNEALGTETELSGQPVPWFKAHALPHGLGLRRELGPISQNVLELRPFASSPVSRPQPQPGDRCLSPIWRPKHRDQVFLPPALHLLELWVLLLPPG